MILFCFPSFTSHNTTGNYFYSRRMHRPLGIRLKKSANQKYFNKLDSVGDSIEIGLD